MIAMIGNIAFAQSASDIATAKAMAKQKGYSDADINAMFNKTTTNNGNQTTGNNKQNISAINRNDSSLLNKRKYFQQRDSIIIPDSMKIFGHDLFKNKNADFFPSYNIPTPENYKLAAGDEVVINIWGAVVKNIDANISPEGTINIPDYGPVYLNGLSVSTAETVLERNLSQVFSGLSGSNPNTYLSISLGKMRSVTINVVGEVERPGSYTLPSLSNMLTALYMAGGPKELGTVRDIKLYRNNRLTTTFDVYDYIIKGKLNTNVRLEDNDVIIVGSYENIVSINGNVKRPMKYEMKPSESIRDLIEYTGGFNSTAYTGNVNIVRTKGEMYSTFSVNKREFSSFRMMDGDSVSVRSNLSRNKNLIFISGAVWHPGAYALDKETASLKQLIGKAGGLLEDAYRGRGLIYRENKLREKEAIGFNVDDVTTGGRDIPLLKSDSVAIKFSPEMNSVFEVSIAGEVKNPTTVTYRSGMTVNDLIFIADSLTDAGQLSNIEVARKIRDRISDKQATIAKADTVSKVFHLDLLNNPSDGDFALEPFDRVYVRRAPDYLDREEATIKGQVFYPGSYNMDKRVVRLSDLVDRAQGFRQEAYVEGATLTRKANKEEIASLKKAMEIKNNKVDSLAKVDIDESELKGYYDIAINLKEAIANPGSNADVILRDSDVINVPKIITTVKIDGAVLRPGVVTYDPQMKLKDYIEKAGGLTQYAWKKRIYMISMNGNAYTKRSKDFEIKPGCRIIIPEKEKNPNKMSVGEYTSIGTSIATLAMTIIYIISKL